MEALTALGLAGNLVQFVAFAAHLVTSTAEIYKSTEGATANILSLDSLYDELSQFDIGLDRSIETARPYLDGRGQEALPPDVVKRTLLLDDPQSQQRSSSFSLLNFSFRKVAAQCQSDCKKLLKIARKLRAQDGTNSRWESFRIALKAFMKKDDIKELESRIHNAQMTLTLFVSTITSHAQEAHAARLEQLRAESQKMKFDQGERFGEVILALDRLKQNIIKLENSYSQRTPPAIEIESIKQQTSDLSASQDVISKEQEILRSLSFPYREDRQSRIPVAHQRTFEWVYHSGKGAPTSATYIAEWFQSDSDLFWVSGKPGSGKSTFMKFVANEPRTRHLLTNWSGSAPLIITSHYFWSAGTAMQKSELGLLRTLIYDILRQWPKLIIPLCEHRFSDQSKDLGGEGWRTRDLRAILEDIAAQKSGPVKYCFFVDGLDEYDGDHDELCQVLRHLATSTNVKICIASRPLNLFEDEFGKDELGNEHRNKLYIQDLTRNDIHVYVLGELSRHRRWHSIAGEGEWLVQEIERRASGVFLWVFFVVREIKEGLTNRDTQSDISRRLHSFPSELGVFFRQILGSIQRFYWNKMSTMLQMAVAATEALHVMAYDFHNQGYEDSDYVFGVPIRPFSPHEDAELKEQMVWRLNSWTRGLLEMNPQTGIVSFLHRTVMDYFKSREMMNFLKEKEPLGFRLDSCLLKVYAAMIKRYNFSEPIIRQDFATYKDCLIQHLVASALTCAGGELELPLANYPSYIYKILDEIDYTVLKRCVDGEVHFKDFRSNLHPKAFVREQLIASEHVAFLSWKLPRDSEYLSGLGTDVLLHVLCHGGYKEIISSFRWRDMGLKMLRDVLKTQNLEMNGSKWTADESTNFTPWTYLFSHTTTWTRGSGTIAEIRFWDFLENDIFSNMLRQKADPMAIIWRDGIAWPAFASYLDLAFEVPPTPKLQSMYLKVLRDFLESGASLNLQQFQFTLPGRVGQDVIIPEEIFLARLHAIPMAGHLPGSLELLADVTDILLAHELNLAKETIDRESTYDESRYDENGLIKPIAQDTPTVREMREMGRLREEEAKQERLKKRITSIDICQRVPKITKGVFPFDIRLRLEARHPLLEWS